MRHAFSLHSARSSRPRTGTSRVPGTAAHCHAARSPRPVSGKSANHNPKRATATATKTTVSNMFVTGARPVIAVRNASP